MAPMGVEAPERDSVRQSTRTPGRPYSRPEEHEKYHIPDEMIPPGMDLMWLPTKVFGMPNGRTIAEFYREGWEPAAAKDFPVISGYGASLPKSLVDRGLISEVGADDPIEIGSQLLVMRPKQLSQRSRQREKSAAQEQVENQMRRLKQASRGFRGTEIRRQHAPLPDMAPQNDGMEE